MKIGICNNENSYTKRYGDKAYIKLRELGFDAVDFNSLADTEGIYYTLPRSESDEMLLLHKKLSGDAGITINQSHGPWRWPPRDNTAEERAERMEKMKRAVRMASIVGTENLVIHPIMPFGIEDIGTENENATWEMNLEFMSELLGCAKDFGVTICFENMPMPRFSIGSPELILKFVKEMNDDNFKICLDTGHVQVYEETGLVLGEETRRLGKYIKCLHVHDNKYGRDMHLFPTFGNADWHDFGKALADIGYNGVFSLEVTPPENISDKLYEEMSVMLRDISREIIGYGNA